MVTWRKDWWREDPQHPISASTWVLFSGANPRDIRHFVSSGTHFIYCPIEDEGAIRETIKEIGTTSAWFLTSIQDFNQILMQVGDVSIRKIQIIQDNGLVIQLDTQYPGDSHELSSKELNYLLRGFEIAFKTNQPCQKLSKNTYEEEVVIAEIAKLRRENRYYKTRIERVKRNPIIRLVLKIRTRIKQLATTGRG